MILSGTIRTFDEETRKQLQAELHETLMLVQALGGAFTLEFKPGYPVLTNNPQISDVIRQTTLDLLGPVALEQPKIEMGSEDFGYMTQQTPGALFFLGARYDEQPRSHHTPLFDINEAVLATGAALLAESSCRLLKTLH